MSLLSEFLSYTTLLTIDIETRKAQPQVNASQRNIPSTLRTPIAHRTHGDERTDGPFRAAHGDDDDDADDDVDARRVDDDGESRQ